MAKLEWNRESEQRVDDVRVSIEFLVNHQSKDAHLSSASIVQFDSEFLVDGFLVPSGGLQLGSLDLLLAKAKADLQ